MPMPNDEVLRSTVATALAQWSVEQTLEVDADAVGIVWLLAAIAQQRPTGMLSVRAAWLTWRVWFVEGRLCQCECEGGPQPHPTGAMALWSLVVSNGLQATLEGGLVPPGEGFAGASTQVVVREVLRQIEQRRGSGLDVDRFALDLPGPAPAAPVASAVQDPLAEALLSER